MGKVKIINDPVYGFVSIPYGILFDIVEHPYFQRLRHISQLGLTHYVYPGALHTRFHHALGALHLTNETIDILRSKNIDISDEEAEALRIAILLHDIGHGPFSHALEHTLVNVHHEELSLMFMERFNEIFEGKLTLAIQIFKNEYSKPFLHQLVSGQLDLDRMDYLSRDSFFTGVSEGVIGYHRIIKMLAVKNNELVVEEKGIYSIEKFLIARRLMYWQVYLHKTGLAAEQMLIKTLERAKQLVQAGKRFAVAESLNVFLEDRIELKSTNRNELIKHFAQIDDHDIFYALKVFRKCDDQTLAFLAKSILERKLFKVELQDVPFDSDYIENVRLKVVEKYGSRIESNFLVLNGNESNTTYSVHKDEIKFLFKDGSVRLMSEILDRSVLPKLTQKFYLCYPKS